MSYETTISAAASLREFCESDYAIKKYRELLAAGDVTNSDPRGRKFSGEGVEDETQEAIEMIRNGAETKDAARAIGITRPQLVSRLQYRGLTITELRNT